MVEHPNLYTPTYPPPYLGGEGVGGGGVLNKNKEMHALSWGRFGEAIRKGKG